jgi:hypothetical protein
MAARIHLNDQFTLYPPLARVRGQSTACISRNRKEKPPKPAPIVVRYNSQVRAQPPPLLQITPRAIVTQQSERIPVSPWRKKPAPAIKKHYQRSPLSAISRPDPSPLPKIPQKPISSPEEPKIFRESDSFHSSRPLKTTFTTRISWARRSTHSNKPLLLLNFEGVLGQWYRPGYGEPYEVYFRQGWEQGVKILMEMFLVVLITSLCKEKRGKVLDIFTTKGVCFDAIYKQRKTDGTSFELDYSQIIQDFGFQQHISSILILSSIGLDHEELKDRSGLALLREKTTSRHRRYLCHCCPCGDPPPLCLLVPNHVAQAGMVSARMDFIAKIIGEWVHFDCKLSRSEVNFLKIYETAGKHGIKKVEISADLLSGYREELRGEDQCYSRSSVESPMRLARILVLAEVGKPAGVATAYQDPRRLGERKLERKLSTRSLL